jgi:hypothetical protein
MRQLLDMNSHKRSIDYFSNILFFILNILIYILMIFVFQVDEEISGKVKEMFIPNFVHHDFLYFLLIRIFSFGARNFDIYLWLGIVLLALSRTLKFMLTKHLLRKTLVVSVESSFNYLILGTSFLLMFCFPIAINIHRIYLGQISPNIWHNPTTEFVMPFALLLFWYSYKFLENKKKKYLYLSIIFLVLNIAIKPSFAFCFAIVYPLYIFAEFLKKKSVLNGVVPRIKSNIKLIKWLSPLFIAVVLIGIQWWLLHQDASLSHGQYIADIAIKPFYAISLLSNNIMLSMFLSILFPLSFLIFYRKEIKNDKLYGYGISYFIVGVAIATLLTEIGETAKFGRLAWQVMMCCYIWFFVTIRAFLKVIYERGYLIIQDKIIASMLFLHFFSGIIYIIKYLITGNYH